MVNHEQFLGLFLRHEGDIKAFVGSLVADPHFREDVFQEVAVILWRRFAEFDPSRSFGAWARGIAAHKIIQNRAQNARFPQIFSPEAIPAVLEAFERTEGRGAEAADALRQCIEQLPPELRRLLTLRYEDELRHADIAVRVESTLDAVYQSLSRIRSRLADCVKRRLAAAG